MKVRSLVISLICVLMIALAATSYAQDVIVDLPPAPELYEDLEVPIEILMGVIGKYTTMVQQYQAMAGQGAMPESVIVFRMAAKAVVSDEESELVSVIQDMSEVAYWVETSIFGRYGLYFSADMSGNLGNIEYLSTPVETYAIARDQGVYASLPLGKDLQRTTDLLPFAESLPDDFVLPDDDLFINLEQVPDVLTSYLMDRLSTLDVGYDGQELTSMGIAHVVRLTFTDSGEVVTLCVLDETWDLHKIEFFDPETGTNTIVIVDEVDLISEVPESAFATDLSGLAEIPYDDFLDLVDLNVLATAATGAPVGVDLSLSQSEAKIDDEVVVRSNGLDAEDAESALTPLIEFRGLDGVWNPLTAVYEGSDPLGHWMASFAPSMPGSYDFRVVYTDTAGVSSDPLELMSALNVIVVPPEIVDVSPAPQATDVLVSSDISASFDQDMDEESVKAAFMVMDDTGTAVSGSVELIDGSFVFSPDQDLKYGQTYTAKIQGTAAALTGATLGDDFAWSFTTEIAPLPMISEIAPADMERDVPVSVGVSVTFTEMMDMASVENAFSLKLGDQEVSGSFLWSDNGKSVSFTPDEQLEYNATYEAMVSGSASSAVGAGLDGNGNGVAEGVPVDNVSWSFSTEAFPVFAVEPSSQAALAGEVVTVDIIAESMRDLLGFKMTISYDPTVLRVLKLERASFKVWRPRPRYISEADKWQETVIDKDNGEIMLAIDSTRAGGIGGTGVIANLTFQTTGVGDSAIELKDVTATDSAGADMPFGLRSGQVQVTAFYPQDVNKDGAVDIRDFVIIQNNRGADADVNGDGVVDTQDIIAVTGAQASPGMVPTEPELGNNFPNPFNPETWIPYQIIDNSSVTLRIYSATGRLVRTLDLGYRTAGRYNTRGTAAHWDGTNDAGENVSSGIYYYSIEAGNFAAVKKMVISE